ncbi:MAG TPA: carbon monoxide dehydrogenase subunit G [Streptosporangiaceae bacterium]|nr:carbon monoxide dehydrogenase subunit G [Streptosporangiaceae bacterium]
MRINGTATVTAPVARVYEALRDPAVLVRTIPGCERLETVGADTYDMTVTAGVASIRGTYVGRVALREPDPPHSFVLRAQGQGAPGTVDATVMIRLSEDQGATTVTYDADTIVGGMIGGVGQRMIGAAAKRTAAEFFTAVEQALTEPEPAAAAVPAPAAVPAAARPGAVYTAPPRPRPAADIRAMVTAFGAGGAVALLGVAIGYALGRRSR